MKFSTNAGDVLTRSTTWKTSPDNEQCGKNWRTTRAPAPPQPMPSFHVSSEYRSVSIVPLLVAGMAGDGLWCLRVRLHAPEMDHQCAINESDTTKLSTRTSSPYFLAGNLAFLHPSHHLLRLQLCHGAFSMPCSFCPRPSGSAASATAPSPPLIMCLVPSQ